jgi:hypothetical protein
MTPFSVIEIYQCFGGTSCFHLLGSRRRHVGKLCIRYGDRMNGCGSVVELLVDEASRRGSGRMIKEAGDLSTHH